MNEQRGQTPVSSRLETQDETKVRELLHEAGARPPIPASDLAIIKAAARHEWEANQRTRPGTASSWTSRRFLAIAAVLLVAVGLGWIWRQMDPTRGAPAVATVEMIVGGDPTVALGSEIRAGDKIVTTSALGMRLIGGQSVRVAADSSLEMIDAGRIHLTRGAVYVDSGPTAHGGLVVETEHGEIRDIGTQFEVRVGGSEVPLRVRVREGEILLSTNGDSRSAAAGEELALSRNGAVRRLGLEISGENWEWVEQLAPSFAMEGRSLREYLDWLGRETGWRIVIEDPELWNSASQIVLHGGLDGISPRESVEVVLPGSGVSHQLVDGRLILAKR